MQYAILIRGIRRIDPAAGSDSVGDLYLESGRIAPLPQTLPADARVLEGRGLAVTPSLIDLHVHLREPGGTEAETVASGSDSAARGGFGTVVAMPNTRPPVDQPHLVRFVLEQGRRAGHTRVLTTACITQGRQGGRVAHLAALAEAGASAFSDDGCTVQSDAVMRQAMERAAELGLPIMDHAQDRRMELRGGVMHEGNVSRRHGLPGIPSEAEIRMIARDIRLAEETGCRVHIQHVSTAEGAALIERAREQGLPVSGEASPHHLALCDEDIDPADACYKMNPPLRSRDDRDAIRRAAAAGALSVFATDHAPHSARAKSMGFLRAPFGIVGLETAVGVTYTAMVLECGMSIVEWVRRWTSGPAQVLGLAPPGLNPGAPADLALLDLASSWTAGDEPFASLSANSPFLGRRLTGRAVGLIRGGVPVWRR